MTKTAVDAEFDVDLGTQFLVDRYRESDSVEWSTLESQAVQTSKLIRSLTEELVEFRDRFGDTELTALFRICQHDGIATLSNKVEAIEALELPQATTEELTSLITEEIGSVGGRQFTLYVGGQDETQPDVERELRDQFKRLIKNLDDEATVLDAAQKIGELPYHSVQSGRMSPIFHYLAPTIFPVINGPVIEGMGQYFNADIDQHLENYLDEREAFIEIRNAYGFQSHFRHLDAFFTWAAQDTNNWTLCDRESISRNVWQIQPGKIALGFPESLWPQWREKDVISVGWELKPDADDLDTQKDVFANRMEAGDIVIIKHGVDELLGIGVLTSNDYIQAGGTTDELYIEGDEETDSHPSLRPIDWVHTVSLQDRIDVTDWELPKQFAQSTVLRWHYFDELRYEFTAREPDRIADFERVEQKSYRLATGGTGGYLGSYTLPIQKFMSSNATREECFRRQLFGDTNRSNFPADTTLVLYDFDQKAVYGPFKAAEELQRDYADDEPWANEQHDYPFQVPVTWRQADLYQLSVDGPPGGQNSKTVTGDDAETLLERLRTEGTPIRISDRGTVTERTSTRGTGGDGGDLFTDAFEAASEQRRTHLYKQAVAHLVAGKNVVFYGPPGSGKTRIATRLTENFCAKSAIETANAEWSRYDIIGGPAPTDDGTGFKPKPGVFTQAAADCAEHLETDRQPVWLLIDELNRANLDQAFGEVFTQLDLDYRDPDHTLPVGDVQVPLAFRLLATMNTSDQAQLFALGYAFRRRFAFVHVPSLLKSKSKDQATDAPALADTSLDMPDVDTTYLRENVIISAVNDAFGASSDLPGDTALGLPQLQEMLAAADDKGSLPTVEYALEQELLQAAANDFIDVLLYVSWRAGDLDLVEFGQGLLIDAVKYVTAKAVIDPQLSWAAVDEAVQSYLLPQFDAIMPELRKDELTADENDLASNLESYIDELRELNLTASAATLERARESKRVI